MARGASRSKGGKDRENDPDVPEFDFYDVVWAKIDPTDKGIIAGWLTRPNLKRTRFVVKWTSGAETEHDAEELTSVRPPDDPDYGDREDPDGE